jgi:hypothetical protein
LLWLASVGLGGLWQALAGLGGLRQALAGEAGFGSSQQALADFDRLWLSRLTLAHWLCLAMAG